MDVISIADCTRRGSGGGADRRRKEGGGSVTIILVGMMWVGACDYWRSWESPRSLGLLNHGSFTQNNPIDVSGVVIVGMMMMMMNMHWGDD